MIVGNSIRLETDFGLVVEYDGDWVGNVQVPSEYRNLVQGICGDYDGDPSNDHTTKNGIDVSGEPDRGSRIGNSWIVHDPENPE